MKRAFLVSSLLVASLLLAACERESAREAQVPPDAVVTQCELTMGWDPWEPYHYMDPRGNMQGMDIDLIRAMAAGAGCSVSFERDHWSSLLGRVRRGEIDLISGATLTPEREVFARFSDPYRDETFGLFLRRGEAAEYPSDSLAAMLQAGVKIGFTDDYIYGPEVQVLQADSAYSEQFVGAELGEIHTTRLLDGVIDAYLEDVVVGTAIIRRRGLEQQIALHPLDLSSGGEVRLMFSRESVPEDVVARFDAALAGLRESGQYDEITGLYLQ